MSDHETTLRDMAGGIYIDASLPLLHLAPAEKAADLAGADALRRGTCGTCRYRISADRNCQLLVMPVETGQRTRPGDVNFSCTFYAPTEPTR